MKYEYVYCFSTPGCLESRKIKGVGGSPVREVRYKDISAVVSGTESRVLDVNEEGVETHLKVLTTVMKNATVVPLAFGMVFNNEEVLLGVLDHAYDAVKDSMTFLGNKVELGVKAIEAKPNGGDQSFHKLFKQKAAERLGRAASSTVDCKLFSSRLMFNAAFLVEKGKVRQFSRAVEELEREYPQLKIQYTGPWPPYNFVTLKIGGD